MWPGEDSVGEVLIQKEVFELAAELRRLLRVVVLPFATDFVVNHLDSSLAFPHAFENGTLGQRVYEIRHDHGRVQPSYSDQLKPCV